MVTDKDLEQLVDFQLDKNRNYADLEDYIIKPTNKSRQEWHFCSFDCVNGDIEEIFTITRDMTMDDVSELYYQITQTELNFK